MGSPPGAPLGPAPAILSPPPGSPVPHAPPGAGGAGWNDPAAFAATAPPPTADEHLKAQGQAAPPEPAAEARASAPPPPEPQPEPEAREPADPLTLSAQAPRVLAGFLVSYEGSDLGTFWAIYQGKNVVGRKEAAEGLDIEIDHPTTSSRHAVVHASARPGRFKIEDTGSTNGTFVNDDKIPQKAPRDLKDGDQLRFGGYAVTVKVV